MITDIPDIPLDQRYQMRSNFLSMEVGRGVHKIIKNRTGDLNYVNTEDLLNEIRAFLNTTPYKHCITIIPIEEKWTN